MNIIRAVVGAPILAIGIALFFLGAIISGQDNLDDWFEDDGRGTCQ